MRLSREAHDALLTSAQVSYLFRTTGQVLGVSLSGALLQGVLLSKLKERIGGPNASEVSHLRRSLRLAFQLLGRSSIQYGKSFGCPGYNPCSPDP